MCTIGKSVNLGRVTALLPIATDKRIYFGMERVMNYLGYCEAINTGLFYTIGVTALILWATNLSINVTF